MATFFSKLFRSKKTAQDKTPGKPAKTTQGTPNSFDRLDPSNPAELKALVAAVQQLPQGSQKDNAIARINTIEQAIAFTHGSSPESFPRLAESINQFFHSDAEALTARISQSDRIALIPWIKSESIVERFLSDITNPHDLVALAATGKSSKVRQLAAFRVNDETSLKTIQKETKGRDKKVFQITKDKLLVIRQAQEKQNHINTQLEQLATQLEAHAKTEVNKLYEPKLNTLLAQWESLLQHADQKQVENIAGFLLEAKEKARTFRETQDEIKRQAEDKAQSEAERNATINTLTQTVESLKANELHNQIELPALDAVIKTQETRWLEATKNADVAKSEQKAYMELMRELKHLQNASLKTSCLPEHIASILSAPRDNSETKLTSGEVKTLKEFVDSIDWPSTYAHPPALSAIQSLLGDYQTASVKLSTDIKKLKSDLERDILALESALEEKLLKKSQQLFKETSKALKALNHSQADSFRARVQLLGAQVEELRDWQGFATHPKQIELCERMESLIAAHLEPQAKADKIKSMQDEWKSLGGSSDQSLWQRFKLASDTAFEPCRAFFDEQKQLKKANIDKRNLICEQLSHFINQHDWQTADWKAVEKIGKVAREEWKLAFPVDFKDNKKLQTTFNQLLDQIDNLLNTERLKNEAAKKAIVSRAQQLMEMPDIQAAINIAKELQKEWTAIGVTRYGEDRKLWKQYREACDTLFGQRDIEKQQQQSLKNDLASQAESICSEAESIASGSDESQNKLAALNKSLIELPMGEKEISSFKGRMHKCMAANDLFLEKNKFSEFKSVWADALQRLSAGNLNSSSELNLPEALSKKLQSIANETGDTTPTAREACVLMEIITGSESPVEDQNIRMQIQVNRLSTGIRQESSHIDPVESFEQLLLQWTAQSIQKSEETVPFQARVQSCLQKFAAAL